MSITVLFDTKTDHKENHRLVVPPSDPGFGNNSRTEKDNEKDNGFIVCIGHVC